MFARIKSATTKFKWLIVAAVVFLSVSLSMVMSQVTYSQTVPNNCAAPYQINWPTTNPLWSLCWTPPNNSSGIDGSGLELRDVFYKGKRVFSQANMPVLNVTYEPGGCGGGPDRSYRDWQYELAPFEANNVVQSGYAEPTVPPRTVCNNPGTDIGTFTGVAVERRTDRLILTTQMPAGWYRYTMKWEFRRDGTIQPYFGFSAVTHPCTSLPHTHHAYWRFDFDVEGSGNDGIDEYNNGTWSPISTEANRRKATGRKWRVLDRSTRRGYEIIPGSGDGPPADTFAVADVWALQSRGNEGDDGGATFGSDRIQINNYINGQSTNNQDVVFWYHASYRHGSGNGCIYVGPTLRLVGSW